jgi:hypothetical protein
VFYTILPVNAVDFDIEGLDQTGYRINSVQPESMNF